MALTESLSRDIILRHLSTDTLDDTDESYILGVLLPAAWESCAAFLDRRVFATAKELPSGDAAIDTDMVASEAFKYAVLLTMGDMFLNREDTEEANPLNRAVKRLLWPLRVGIGI